MVIPIYIESLMLILFAIQDQMHNFYPKVTFSFVSWINYVCNGSQLVNTVGAGTNGNWLNI